MGTPEGIHRLHDPSRTEALLTPFLTPPSRRASDYPSGVSSHGELPGTQTTLTGPTLVGVPSPGPHLQYDLRPDSHWTQGRRPAETPCRLTIHVEVTGSSEGRVIQKRDSGTSRDPTLCRHLRPLRGESGGRTPELSVTVHNLSQSLGTPKFQG